MPPSDRDERVVYTYEPYREEWDAWKESVPREQPLYQRLNELLDIDRRFDLRELTAPSDERDPLRPPLSVGALLKSDRDTLVEPPDDAIDIKVVALRIRRRCMTALPAARTNGCDKAADEIAEIKTLADAILDVE